MSFISLKPPEGIAILTLYILLRFNKYVAISRIVNLFEMPVCKYTISLYMYKSLTV